MYAIIESGGKQLKVKKGDVIFLEKIKNVQNDEQIEFQVLACGNENDFFIGNPYVNSAKVAGKVIKVDRTKKITVFTYKPKKHVKRKKGHRQWYTKVEIDNIVVPNGI
jgi:large subunit ribosomal protein L21